MIGLTTALVRSDRALAQELQGELVLVHVDTGMYYTLNEVGSRIWAMCDGTRTVAQMITRVCEEFDAPAETVESDVVDLVADLRAERLLVDIPETR